MATEGLCDGSDEADFSGRAIAEAVLARKFLAALVRNLQ